jgi:hypothetical protein
MLAAKYLSYLLCMINNKKKEIIVVKKVTCPILKGTYHIQKMEDGLRLNMKVHRRDLNKLLHQQWLGWQGLFL